jgi:hypothetical protein
MKRLVVTQHTVRCPLDGATATLNVRTDARRGPCRRYLNVTGCSLLPPASSVPFSRAGYFADVAPPLRYIRDVETGACATSDLRCAKRCLAVLNAAEPGAAEAMRCTSAVSDALELARQTQSPAMMRVLWSYAG